ncbi:hypothetical protein DNTS_008586 [Danionella cerebrum]|uniref:HMG box domain-containing protein n=1 Tax=Danionella cerebrum TaxID=2873325 RepID=A0A553Q6B5_9TELE|nr:hypothetical protein DNTS_008586 [Danionella translucida]
MLYWLYHLQYLQMKWPLLDVPSPAALKDSRSPTPGHLWHSLSREEQAKYYELARKERQLHSQLYPGWSARDNYGKRKKRKRDSKPDSPPEDCNITTMTKSSTGRRLLGEGRTDVWSITHFSNKVPVVQHPHHVHPLTPLITYSNEHFSPGTPPSHLSPEILDPKTGIPRTPHPAELSPYYPLSPGAVGQIPHPLGWLVPQQGQHMYSIPPGGFRHPYPALAMNASMSSLVSSRFSPHMVPHPPHGLHQTGIPHPAIVSPAIKQEPTGEVPGHSTHGKPPGPVKKEEEKKPHIKKPLNAFMLYMKEMRAKVWHSLSREEQAKYYELARKERQLHSQLYPGWSARDNYGKRKKRKRDSKPDSPPEGTFSPQAKKPCMPYLPSEKMCDSPTSSHGSMLDSPATPSAALASPAAPAATHSEQAQPLSLTTKPEARAHHAHFSVPVAAKPSSTSASSSIGLLSRPVPFTSRISPSSPFHQAGLHSHHALLQTQPLSLVTKSVE